MTEYKKPYVIAEIGCNHKGDMEIAKELIKIAKIFCNADASTCSSTTRPIAGWPASGWTS